MNIKGNIFKKPSDYDTGGFLTYHLFLSTIDRLKTKFLNFTQKVFDTPQII